MNLQNIINEIEKVDPEVYDKMDGRRAAMKNFTNFGSKIALAALPLAIGSMFNKAYASPTGTKDAVIDVLNFALSLECLESEFYKAAYAAAMSGTLAIPTGAPMMAIQTIRDHEVAHVNFLQTAITAAGGTPKIYTAVNFDFTAKGTFPTVFSDYGLFLAVAQTFEDTGVRAYKGQAGNLISNNDVLTAALNIHSVEARHASHIRSMRRNFTSMDTIKPWITGKDTGGIGAAVQASYDGEENTNQATIEIVGINGQAISTNAATECFDEPLTMDQVLAIVDPFIV